MIASSSIRMSGRQSRARQEPRKAVAAFLQRLLK
jgi:hypothetical protein